MPTHTSPIIKLPFSRIDELDGLRGILALWVALIHIISWCGLAPLAFSIPATAKRLWDESAQGAVDVFIILCGFVITYLLYSRPQPYGQFMIGRFFRIYPVYLVCLLLGFSTVGFTSFLLNHASWRETPYFQAWLSPAATAQSTRPISHLLTHLTLLFGVIPEKIMPKASTTLLAPAWSITLEWQYYLLAPLLARLVFFRASWVLLGLVGASSFIFSHFWSDSFLPIKLPLFLVGIGSFHLYIHARRQQMSSRFITFSMLIIVASIVSISWHWMALTVWTLVFGCLILDANDCQSDVFWGRWLGGLRKLLLKPALQELGKISYPLYLIHWPIIILLMFGLIHWQPDITSTRALIIMLFVGLPVILGAAFLLHQFIEAPMMKFGKRFSQ
jgi:peptidoglycan/LPS O-acetylase OafA/YrhL